MSIRARTRSALLRLRRHVEAQFTEEAAELVHRLALNIDGGVHAWLSEPIRDESALAFHNTSGVLTSVPMVSR